MRYASSSCIHSLHDKCSNSFSKIDPISGQGGNNAIKDAATLINSLTRWLSSHHSRQESIATILSTVQASRIDRMRQLAKEAHLLQSMLTQKAFASQIVSKYLVPSLGIENILLRRINAICVEAPHINMLPMPATQRSKPFNDELPSRPEYSQRLRQSTWYLLIGSKAICCYSVMFYHSLFFFWKYLVLAVFIFYYYSCKNLSDLC